MLLLFHLCATITTVQFLNFELIVRRLSDAQTQSAKEIELIKPNLILNIIISHALAIIFIEKSSIINRALGSSCKCNFMWAHRIVQIQTDLSISI